nr:RNA 3'-terminal phosphate cyclase [Halopiger goleimassiliensis]
MVAAARLLPGGQTATPATVRAHRGLRGGPARLLPRRRRAGDAFPRTLAARADRARRTRPARGRPHLLDRGRGARGPRRRLPAGHRCARAPRDGPVRRRPRASGDDRRESVPRVAIVLRMDHGTGLAGVDALGERGTPAERVGEDAADAANRFLEGDAPVDRHMADQLLVFLALAGGQVRVPAVTDHVAASCDLLESFGVAVDPPTERERVVAVEPDDAIDPGRP